MLVRTMAAFFAVNFLFGGAALALYYFTPVGISAGLEHQNGVFYINLSLPMLFTIFAASYLIINYALWMFKKRTSAQGGIVSICLKMNGKTCALQGIIDTGNMLRGPDGKDYALICELSAIKQILDKDTYNFLSEGDCISSPKANIIYLNYSTLSQRSAIIPAFYVNAAEYDTDGSVVLKENVLVAVTNSSISNDSSGNALVNPKSFLSEEIENDSKKPRISLG